MRKIEDPIRLKKTQSKKLLKVYFDQRDKKGLAGIDAPPAAHTVSRLE